MRWLWEHGFGENSADGVCVPEPVGLIPALHLWLQRKVPGKDATRLLSRADGTKLARHIAAAIHKLHRADVPAPRSHTMADELRILDERLPAVAHTKPGWGRRLGRLLDACRRLGEELPPPTRAHGIHRDFYADHVIVDGQRLYLIDLDLCCMGDPALDVGNFLGHIIEQCLRTTGRPDAMALQQHALAERFAELAGMHARDAVEVYTTLTLARHVHLSTRFPERTGFTEALLELCERRLGIAPAARRTTQHRVTTGAGT